MGPGLWRNIRLAQCMFTLLQGSPGISQPPTILGKLRPEMQKEKQNHPIWGKGPLSCGTNEHCYLVMMTDWFLLSNADFVTCPLLKARDHSCAIHYHTPIPGVRPCLRDSGQCGVISFTQFSISEEQSHNMRTTVWIFSFNHNMSCWSPCVGQETHLKNHRLESI